jgi:hypothetical protein
LGINKCPQTILENVWLVNIKKGGRGNNFSEWVELGNSLHQKVEFALELED